MNIKETRAVLNIIQCAHWSRYTDYKLKIHQNQERKALYTTSSDLELLKKTESGKVDLKIHPYLRFWGYVSRITVKMNFSQLHYRLSVIFDL